MSELHIPERALLRPRHIEESEANSPANYQVDLHWLRDQRNLHHLTSFLVRKVLSFPVVETPYLPTTKAHDAQNYRTWENIPLRSPDWAPQIYRRNRKSSNNRKTNHEGEASPRESVEERRSNFESEFIVKDGRETAHNAREAELTQQLEPILRDGVDPLVLLCWGEKHHCSIVPVQISDLTDEVTSWGEIKQAWYSHRGYWRRYVPFFGVERIDVAELSIAGMNSGKGRGSKKGTKFVGMYATEDLHIEKRRLEGIIEDYQEQDFPCPYDTSTGVVDCLQGCVSGDLDGRCPEMLLIEAKRKLQNLETRSLMKLAFFDPSLAALNEFLKGEELVYGHRNILEEMNEWHRPKLRELRFRGIVIKEDWKIHSKHVIISLAMSLSFPLVTSAKYLFGGWATAWTVGCFFLALLSLCKWAK